jgi:hypothetical protein
MPVGGLPVLRGQHRQPRVARRRTGQGIMGTARTRPREVGLWVMVRLPDAGVPVPGCRELSSGSRLRPDQARRMFGRLASPDAANPDVAHD